MAGRDVYDISPKQKEILLYRQAKRLELRELYLKQSGHPTKSLLCDTAIFRYAAAKASYGENFVPRAVDFFTKMGVILALIGITAYSIKKSRDGREHMYRTGQVKYADRLNKFV